jgi:4-hydroxy-4-methyl-2-oxoglutarate aldolase
MADDILIRLRRLDTCAISDALDRHGLAGAVGGLAARSVRQRIAGRIRTVKLGIATPGVTAAKHLCTTAIEQAEPGDVIVVEQRTGLEAAGWGGILSTGARVKGLSGVIVEGPARDVDEALELGFPVYSRSATARTARGRIVEVATGEPIQVGEFIVNAGDYVVADSSCVVFVKAADIERVVETAEQIAAREAAMAKAALAGQPIGTVMGADYEKMLGHK